MSTRSPGSAARSTVRNSACCSRRCSRVSSTSRSSKGLGVCFTLSPVYCPSVMAGLISTRASNLRGASSSRLTSSAKWSLIMLEGTLPLRKPGRRASFWTREKAFCHAARTTSGPSSTCSLRLQELTSSTATFIRAPDTRVDSGATILHHREASSRIQPLPGRLGLDHQGGRGRLDMLEPALQALAQDGERPAQGEVEDDHGGVDAERAKGRVVDDLGRARELGEADDGGEGRSLEELDQEPHGGRKGDAQRLGQDDEAKLREVPEAQRVGRFPLFAGHGLDASAPDLAEKRARVQDEPQRRRRPGIAPDVKEAGPEVHEVELDQQWRPLEDPDVPGDHPRQRLPRRDPEDGDDEAGGATADEGDGGEENGPAHGQHQEPELVKGELADHRVSAMAHREKKARWIAAKAAWNPSDMAR